MADNALNIGYPIENQAQNALAGYWNALRSFLPQSKEEAAEMAAYATPGLGNVLSAKDAVQGLYNRDWLGAGIGAAGLLPFGGLIKGAARAERAALKDRSPEFRKWFGASKATDDSGAPLVLYHGSNQPLETITPGYKEPGAWFTTDLSNAANYARGEDAHIHSVHLKAENPFVVRFNDRGQPTHEGTPIEILDRYGDPLEGMDNLDIVRHADRRGYDSVHFPDGNYTESGNTWVVFNPHQIKSVDNYGAFDPTDRRIMYGLAGAPLAISGTNAFVNNQNNQ